MGMPNIVFRCQRLEHKYKSPKARAFYSKNLQTWTFALD